jgi:hypothetical protein
MPTLIDAGKKPGAGHHSLGDVDRYVKVG